MDKYEEVYIMKVIIVGGVAGGASCAARLRRLDESAQIIVFEKSGFVSYANCGLPYYVGGTIAERSALTLQTPASFRARFNVDVRVRHEVTSIYRARKCVRVRDLESGREFEETYDKLVLSPGARPVVPPLPGIDGKNIFTLRTVEDALRIRAFVDANRPAAATVVRIVEEVAWRCTICGYIAERETLPDDYRCPICRAPKDKFVKM